MHKLFFFIKLYQINSSYQIKLKLKSKIEEEEKKSFNNNIDEFSLVNFESKINENVLF